MNVSLATAGIAGCIVVLQACGSKPPSSTVAPERSTAPGIGSSDSGAAGTLGGQGGSQSPTVPSSDRSSGGGGSAGSTDVGPPPVPFCGGGAELEISYVVSLQGNAGPIGSMLVRNGRRFFRIDGDCRYWVLAGGDRAPILAGTLSEEQARDLSADLRMADWGEWYGAFIPANIADASGNILVAPEGEFGCIAACESPLLAEDAALAQELAPVFAEAEAWLDSMISFGQPVNGPVRVLGRTSGSNREHFVEGVITEEWRGSIALQDLVFDEEESAPANGVRVEGADADYLRQLRVEADARYRLEPNSLSGLVVVADGDSLIELFVSDVLPMEDESGVVPR